MQDSVPSVLDNNISTRPYSAAELFARFLTNQANTLLTPRILGCDSDGGRATRMAPDATTEKIQVFLDCGFGVSAWRSIDIKSVYS